jgi:hypothetical protein
MQEGSVYSVDHGLLSLDADGLDQRGEREIAGGAQTPSPERPESAPRHRVFAE